MSEFYPVIEVRPEMRGDVEQMGSKPKFWFKYYQTSWLFKEARENTGEDWAEKIASEIAALIGLPTHHTELAVWQGVRGCAVKSFLTPKKDFLIHGNELLGGFLDDYDTEKVRGQSDHTFENIVGVIEKLFAEGKPRRNAAILMVGYLVFDALVGNTDRHHQNWGVLLRPTSSKEHSEDFLIKMAPTFDHASSLGRELRDTARKRHLEENTIKRYIRKGKGGIFEHANAKHGLSPMELAGLLAARYPEFFRPWQKRVAEIEKNDLVNMFSRVPADRISPEAVRFALALLENTKQLLVEL